MRNHHVGIAASLLGITLLALLPFFTSSRAIVNWGFLMLLYAALAQSWNLLGGFGGQVNLGHAAFFGLGALVTRVLWLGGQPLWTALVAATAVAIGMGVLVGAPSLRLRGPYFAIGTLAIAEILRITVGTLFPQVSALPTSLLATYRLDVRYYLVLGLAIAVTGVAWWLTRSRFGYGLAAVREDESVAEAIGVPVFQRKLGAFVLSSCFAGIAGGIYAYYHVSFYPAFAFSPLWTLDPLLITFLGGVGTIWGPIVGAVFFFVLQEVLALRFEELHLLIFGVIFVAIVIALPGGFMEARRSILARLVSTRPSSG